MTALDRQFVLQNNDRYPVVVESGQGCYVTDVDGKRYLDMISGIGVNALGYCHPRITAAIIEQAAVCVHTSNLVHHRYQGLLAQKLCAISGLDRAFFANSGTEAMEAALKAVRLYWNARGSRRARLVALHQSFHGRTPGSLAITGQPLVRRPFEPLASPVTFVDGGDGDALRRALGDDAAALVIEPVLGEGGVYPLAEEFLRDARELTNGSGALLVADETQCGLGRTGKHFAYQWASIQPDIVVTAKPLGGGLPLGATLFTEAVAGCFPVHSHGTTFGGGPLVCRVALEFLDVLDELLPHIRDLGAELRSGLEWLSRRHPRVAGIRSKGLMFGLQLTAPGHALVDRAIEHGLLGGGPRALLAGG